MPVKKRASKKKVVRKNSADGRMLQCLVTVRVKEGPIPKRILQGAIKSSFLDACDNRKDVLAADNIRSVAVNLNV